MDTDVSIDARHGSLILFGRVDADRKICEKRVRVKVQMKTGRGWKTKATDRTNRNGKYKVEIGDKEGRYRAKAPKFSKIRGGTKYVCQSTKATLNHRH